MFDNRENRLIWSYDNEILQIEAWGKNALRVRCTQNAAFTGNDWALLPQEEEKCTVDIAEYPNPATGPTTLVDAVGVSKTLKKGTIKNGKISAEVDHLGRIIFRNEKGEPLLREQWRIKKGTNPKSSLEKRGREFKAVNGDSFRIKCRFEPNENEKIFGMGQYQMPFLDMKGCTLELAHRNSQVSIPFYLSDKGYGMLWNNPAIGEVTFGKNTTVWSAVSAKEADFWITAGDSPAEIEENYANVTGKVPMMPEYGMGFWQCKLRYRSQEELLAVAREHKRRGLPMDVIVVDFFHWTQQGEYKFNPKDWPDPEAMCRELEELGIKVMVSIWPTVDYRSENFAEMMERGCLVRTERGVRVTMQAFGQEVFIDPTNPETRKFVWEKVKKNYFEKGIQIFWLDEAEPEYSVYDFDNYRYYLGSSLETGNIYPVMYAKGFFDGMKESGVENPLNLIRCAWAGSQKYGTLLWSGDIESSFETLQNQVRAGISMGLSGIPWWTTDIGGFYGAATADVKFRELLVRWFEYGCFCPVFRLHGNRAPIHGFDGDLLAGTGTFGSGADNEVWSYGEECYEIFAFYLKLRERLRPYIREIMTQAHEKGTPVMRPLFYEFPQDENAWEVSDQYMFGADLLVAPVIEEKQTVRSLYLPKGAKWLDVWSGKMYDGGVRIETDAPLERIPLFARDGREFPITEK